MKSMKIKIVLVITYNLVISKVFNKILVQVEDDVFISEYNLLFIRFVNNICDFRDY
jgi:hypothetical protein